MGDSFRAPANVPPRSRHAYHKWVKFYIYFCQEFGFPATAPTALGPFLAKLAEKKHSIDDRHEAASAVRLFLRYEIQERNLYLQLSAPTPSPAPGGPDSSLARTLSADQSPGSVVPPPQKASWEREYQELETAPKAKRCKITILS